MDTTSVPKQTTTMMEHPAVMSLQAEGDKRIETSEIQMATFLDIGIFPF
jgi:hypothetical protein